MSKLNKQSILALLVGNTTPKSIHIDDVGDFYFKKLSVGEQGELAELKDNINVVELPLHLVTYSLCDDKGNRLFDKDDIDTLKQMEAEVLGKLVEHINKINGFDVKLDDTKKN